MKYLSVFAGIEAASVAWSNLGWTPVAFSEIEPFPCAVLAHHYPLVPNLGDVTRFDEWPEDLLAEVDVIIGGSPCQSFSIAGLRGGLQDARGNLALVYVMLIEHIDRIREKNGRQPVVIVWENVVGVLSDKTNAFGALVAALAGQNAPVATLAGSWPTCGVFWGEKRRVGYRVLDAQYFGVAQRRRRVFLVATHNSAFASLGDRACPGEILSIADSLRGDPAPSRKTRQGTAGAAAFSAGNSSDARSIGYTEEGSPPLRASASGSNQVPTLVHDVNRPVSDTVTSKWAKQSGGPSGNETGNMVLQPVVLEDQGGSVMRVHQDGVAGTLRRETHGHEPIVLQPAIGIQSTIIGRKPENGPQGSGLSEEVGFTLTKADQHAVAAPAYYSHHPADSRVEGPKDTADTVNARYGTGGGNVPIVEQPIAKSFRYQNEVDGIVEDDVSATLKSSGGSTDERSVSAYVAQPIPLDLRNAGRDPEKHDEQNRQGVGVGQAGDPAHTVTSAFVHGVAIPLAIRTANTNANGHGIAENVTHTLDQAQGQAIAEPIAFKVRGGVEIDSAGKQAGKGYLGSEGLAFTLATHQDQQVAQPIAWSEELTPSIDIGPTIQRGGQGGRHDGVMTTDYVVRRLTVTECESLMGFPRNYTNIPWRNKPDSPDGPRYKALGNSMATPVVLWVGWRIDQAFG